MLVKQPLDQNTCESAVASSGIRLNMTSHSDAPRRGKRMPASARRYCPVMLQVHSLWMLFISVIRYIRRAALSPRDGNSPGEAAVQRMKRQPSREVTTIVPQLVMNAPMARLEAISDSGVILKYEPGNSMSSTRKKPRVHHRIAAAGTTSRQKDVMICMRMLTLSSSQIGAAYRQIAAGRLSFAQRPLSRAGAPSHISCGPTSLRMGVNGVIQLPRPTVTFSAMAARIPILQSVPRRTGPICSCCPDHLVVWM